MANLRQREQRAAFGLLLPAYLLYLLFLALPLIAAPDCSIFQTGSASGRATGH